MRTVRCARNGNLQLKCIHSYICAEHSLHVATSLFCEMNNNKQTREREKKRSQYFFVVRHCLSRRTGKKSKSLEYGKRIDARIRLRLLIYFLFGGVFFSSKCSASVLFLVLRVS